jgi:hypothetical protein
MNPNAVRRVLTVDRKIASRTTDDGMWRIGGQSVFTVDLVLAAILGRGTRPDINMTFVGLEVTGTFFAIVLVAHVLLKIWHVDLCRSL